MLRYCGEDSICFIKGARQEPWGEWLRSLMFPMGVGDFLQKHNRFGIPLSVIYSKSYPNGIVLSELLTIKEIIDTLEKIN